MQLYCPSAQNKFCRVFSKYLLLVVLFTTFSSAWAGLPLPGSQIINIASGDYMDEQGNTLVIDSNPVSLAIQEVRALSLTNNQNQVGLIGAKLNFPHVLTNTGNVADSYSLNLVQASNDNFDLTNVAVYADRDQNGIPDDNINLLNTGSTLSLDAGESISIVVAGTIPSTASKTNQANFTLTATSKTSSSVTQSVNDIAQVIDDAVILVTKSQSVSSGNSIQDVTYTLSYTNNGSAPGKLIVTDILDSGLRYVSTSASWSNGSGTLTEADDNESSANTGIKYKVVGNQVQFELANIPALTTGAVSFKATVNDIKLATIANTAEYSQYAVNGTTAIRTTKTNTVIYRNQYTYGVIANVTSTGSNDNGNPNQAPDNLTTKPAINAGEELLFDDYIWNTGSTTDSFNLTVSSAGLPACASVKLYASDGRTPLVDSNNDGIVDTGILAAGASRAIKLGISTTANCSASQAIYADLTATSVTDTTKSNAVRNEISAIIVGTTDLYNNNIDKLGYGVGNIDNNGAAFVNKVLQQGKAVFPLIVNNSAPIANNYTLYASNQAINLNNPVSGLPDGWQVNFYEGDASCTTLGKQITQTGSVAAGTSKNYCAVVQASNTITNTSLAIWFAVKSAINGQGDVIKNQVNVEPYRGFTLQNDQQGQVDVAGTVVYLHSLKNIGSLTEGTSTGQVLLKVTPMNNQDNFNYTLYYDANNNGLLDSTDPIANDLATITNNIGLASNQTIQLLLKVQAPPTAKQGITSQVTLVVEPVGTLQGLSATSVQNTDVTTVGINQLRLVKSQASTPCGISDLTTLNYSVSAVQVKPNQCVAYRLTVNNDSATQAKSVTIADSAPAFTTLKTSPAPSVTQGTVTVNQSSIKADVGTLDASQKAALYFLILVNP
nr:hypothetical protein [Moraxella osloensis]